MESGWNGDERERAGRARASEEKEKTVRVQQRAHITQHHPTTQLVTVQGLGGGHGLQQLGHLGGAPVFFGRRKKAMRMVFVSAAFSS
jgi:hypothetical protein